MKIIQVVHRFPREGGAGAENYSRQLCDALAKNHEVMVVTRAEPSGLSRSYCSVETVPGFPYPVRAFSIHPRDTDRLAKNYWNPDLDEPFRDICQAFRPDIIHFQHCIRLSVSLIHTACESGVPVFMTLHDFWFVCPGIIMLDMKNSPCTRHHNIPYCWLCQAIRFPGPRIIMGGLPYIRRRKQRMAQTLRMCRRIFTPSHCLNTAISSLDIPPYKIRYWPHGIDQTPFTNRKPVDAPSHSPIRFGYIGTFSEQKGIDTLLEAFSIGGNDHAELWLYGNAGRDADTQRRVQEWKARYSSNPRITFKGVFTPGEIGTIHRDLDVIVVPSRWYENRPLAILESFAAGNPVIGSDIGGIAELIGPSQAGWLFERNNTQDLAQIIRRIITDPESITEKRQNIPQIPQIADEAQDLLLEYQRDECS